jgi:hypothetical protein
MPGRYFHVIQPPKALRPLGAGLAVAAIVASMAPAGAAGSTEVVDVPIVRAAGTCPHAIPVSVVTTRFDGGATFDVTVRLGSAAYPSRIVSATIHRIEFAASLVPAFATCEGSGRSSEYAFALHRGKLSFVMTPAGEANEPPSLLDVSADPPHVKIAQPD